MQYVLVVEVDEALLDGDDSIEHAASVINASLDRGTEGTVPITSRPLSEVLAC